MKISILGITGKMGNQLAELITSSAPNFLAISDCDPPTKPLPHRLNKLVSAGA